MLLLLPVARDQQEGWQSGSKANLITMGPFALDLVPQYRYRMLHHHSHPPCLVELNVCGRTRSPQSRCAVRQIIIRLFGYEAPTRPVLAPHNSQTTWKR